MDKNLDKCPPGWKSHGAIEAERHGLLDAIRMAKVLNVPSDFVSAMAPKHEWHHVRKETHIGRRYYYEPRRTVEWFGSKRGAAALKTWMSSPSHKSERQDKCVLSGMLNEIKEASQKNLVLCFVGVGSAWAKKNAHTSLIIAKNGKTLLVDMGRNVPDALQKQGINTFDFDAYHFTHSHSDHVGGVEDLMLQSRYIAKKKPEVIITENYQRELWEFTLKGGSEYNESGLLRFSDLMMPLRPTWIQERPREMYRYVWNSVELVIFRTIHVPGNVAKWEQAFWSTGLLIDGRIIFTADTRFDPTIFHDLDASIKPVVHADPAGSELVRQPEAVFHDCQLLGPGTVHATYAELCSLPEDIKRVTHLTHYGDQFESVDPAKDGFVEFTKPWHIYRF